MTRVATGRVAGAARSVGGAAASAVASRFDVALRSARLGPVVGGVGLVSSGRGARVRCGCSVRVCDSGLAQELGLLPSGAWVLLRSSGAGPPRLGRRLLMVVDRLPFWRRRLPAGVPLGLVLPGLTVGGRSVVGGSAAHPVCPGRESLVLASLGLGLGSARCVRGAGSGGRSRRIRM